MADSDGFFEENHLGTTSFSELLMSNDDADVMGLHDMGNNFHCSTGKTSKMLCFGGYQNENEVLLYGEATRATPQRSGVTCSDSSSVSSANTNTTTTTTNNNNNKTNVTINPTTKSNRKRNRSVQEPAQLCSTITQSPLSNPKNSRKAKTSAPKMRKEKLGDRITALQQLVSPFGKTDTASVLHEAMGYIRFLQDQVQVLCSPYLQDLPVSTQECRLSRLLDSFSHYFLFYCLLLFTKKEGGENGGESTKDLRSRGLCLVPTEYVVHVASTNGADYWSPAMVGNHFSPSSSL
ncbi:hypothetical protein Tsubulata_013181 [Turnera subulata]|uniref:BHLH domain-containing protein n=1 Tax=Turnera subulata TaxID=218843 RepID=A0A9Q0FVM2_9ROSI|nr:hypothetical protein Tsubulata_013181 [Turnera subulata]